MAISKIRDYSGLIDNFTQTQNLSEGSISTYTYNLQLFFGYLGNRPFNRTNVSRYVKQIKNQGLKEKTITNRVNTIKSFSKWLWEEDRLPEKEFKKIRGIKVKTDPGQDNRRALTPEEEDLGFEIIANPLLRMMFWTGLHYGLRLSEYINLKLNDVDLKKRILTIKQSKGNKTRRIKILKTQTDTWRQWFKTREAYSLAHEYVFFTDRGKAGTRTLERYFNKISEMIIGKPFKDQTEIERITSHTLRYTFAVKCWRSGLDILVLSKILGHTNLTTTQTYLRVIEEEILDKYEQQASRIF
ncbi:MAG: tyrosine-type recombinase/integrase [Candidatus Hodarchaeales archaeon]